MQHAKVVLDMILPRCKSSEIQSLSFEMQNYLNPQQRKDPHYRAVLLVSSNLISVKTVSSQDKFSKVGYIYWRSILATPSYVSCQKRVNHI